MIYLVNAFSLNMLDINGPIEVEIFPFVKKRDYGQLKIAGL